MMFKKTHTNINLRKIPIQKRTRKHNKNVTQHRSKSLGSDLDQFYTTSSITKHCVKKLKSHLHPTTNYTYVDFSCGPNMFAELLGLPYTAYDISPPSNAVGTIIPGNWFSVKNLPNKHDDTNIIIGFNPPWGWHGINSRHFIEHGLRFMPKIFCLLVGHIRNDYMPANYIEVYAEKIDCRTAFIGVTGLSHAFLRIWKRRKNDSILTQPNIVITQSQHVFSLQNKKRRKFYYGKSKMLLPPPLGLLLVRSAGVNSGIQSYWRTPDNKCVVAKYNPKTLAISIRILEDTPTISTQTFIAIETTQPQKTFNAIAPLLWEIRLHSAKRGVSTTDVSTALISLN